MSCGMTVTKSLQLWSDSERSATVVEPLTFNQASSTVFDFSVKHLSLAEKI